MPRRHGSEATGRRKRFFATATTVSLLVVLWLGACTVEGAREAPRPQRVPEGAQVVVVALREWSVTPHTRFLKAGDAYFVLVNVGNVPHEFEVLQAGRKLAGSEALQPGESRVLRVNLPPGLYEIACRLVTEGGGERQDHYALGMRGLVRVMP
ncbi:MAG: cupredoxin domain-containing protein [Clostridia bacterium]|nr:cupredoxin domain-containing protein [Clostridia bacterium]